MGGGGCRLLPNCTHNGSGSGRGEEGRRAEVNAAPCKLKDLELLHEVCVRLGKEGFVGGYVATSTKSESTKGREGAGSGEESGVGGGGELDVDKGELHKEHKGEEVRNEQKKGEAHVGERERGDCCQEAKVDWYGSGKRQ
jgi:hypothetical protein